ncbi:HGGxSTG domain-containing protein [Armatimonas sp.]|uniref:HGGxSTG domain-containing protein n=1 Tax=Armatimonas sp. TaxID=1872638 RepID=UPI0034D9544C
MEKAEGLATRLDRCRRCGAKTRKGSPCQCKPEPGQDRCKLHGGKSTGPKTEAIRESNRRRAQARREALQLAPL